MLALRLPAESPNTELLWLLYAGLGFFLLVILTGWLTSPQETGQARTRDEAHNRAVGKSAVRLKRPVGGVPRRQGETLRDARGARRKKVK